MHQCKYWQYVAVVTGSVKWKNGEMYFDTIGLGRQSGDKLIMMHRSLQMLMGLTNLTMATVKLAYHTAVVIVLVVLCNFLLIRHGRYLVSDGTLMGYGIVGIMIVDVFVAILLWYSECYLVDEVDTVGIDFKNGLLAITPRKSRMYKTVRSMQSYTLKTTYPCFQVNISTFMEWCDVIANNHVNLLVL